MTVTTGRRKGGIASSSVPPRRKQRGRPQMEDPVSTPDASRRDLLTNSRLGAFRRCPRLHHLRYVEKVRPVVEADPLRFGTLIHHALEAWWSALLVGTRGWRGVVGPDAPWHPGAVRSYCPEAPLDAALRCVGERACLPDALAPALDLPMVDDGLETIESWVPGFPRDSRDLAARIRAEELLRLYDARWRDALVEPLAVEVEFLCPMLNPATGAASQTYELAGKLDVLGRLWHLDGERPNSESVFVEHKTTSEDVRPGGAYRRRLRGDGQVSLYVDGAHALGLDVAACIYDVIVKPRIVPLSATPVEARRYTKPTKADPVPRLYANQRERDETPDEYRTRLRKALEAAPDAFLLREDVVRLDGELDEARADVWHTARMIRESELARRAPRNPAACQAFGRDCEFFEVCYGGASIDDTTLYRRIADAHEELSSVRLPVVSEEV